MDSFVLNGRSIKWDQLEKADPLSVYEENTLTFLKDWKSGRMLFTVPTSGSTGKPGNISLTRQQLIRSAQKTNQFLHLTPDDHAYVCLNTEFIAGKMMLVRAIIAGMELTIEDPSSEPLQYSVSAPAFTALVPMQLTSLLVSQPVIFEKFKAILIGGAPLSFTSRSEISRTVKVPVYETYGMTETVTHIAMKRITGPDPDDFFQVLPGVVIRCDDRQCLEIKSDITENEWITTNDVVRLINTTSFEWLGRYDFVINSGGIKIHPESVEKKLEQLFAEKQWNNRFFIAGTRDERLGDKVTLFIEGELPAGTTDFDHLLNEYFTDSYARPRKIIYIPAFSETGSGKIDRLKTIALAT